MVLTTLIDIDGQMGWLLLLLPPVVLTLIAVGVIAGRDRAVSRHEPHADLQPVPAAATRTMAAPSPARPLPTASEPRQPAPSATAPAPVVRQAAAEPPAPPANPQFAPAPAAVPAASSIAAQQSIAARQSELLQAEQRFDDAAIARVSLLLARQLMACGVSGEAVKSHLRRAIILASRLKDDDTHAAARLELGDIMVGEHDLTTACEHWQIARQIFWDHGAKAEQAEVDRRMMANHCPTDWVLNDF